MELLEKTNNIGKSIFTITEFNEYIKQNYPNQKEIILEKITIVDMCLFKELIEGEAEKLHEEIHKKVKTEIVPEAFEIMIKQALATVKKKEIVHE